MVKSRTKAIDNSAGKFNKPKGMNSQEFAKSQGFSAAYVTKLVKSGVIARDAKGQIDPVAAAAALTAKRHPARSQSRRGQPPVNIELETEDGESLSTLMLRSRIKTETEHGKKLELENARSTAHLVPLGEINAWVAGMIIRSREILVRIAPELKDRLAQQPNPHECERLVASEVYRALNELAEYRPSGQ